MAKILAQLVIQGARVFGRAFGRALQQEYEASQQAARARAGGSGGASGGDSGGGGGGSFSVHGGMSVDEAMKVLNVSELDVERIGANYQHLFEANSRDGSGSFYLQSKVVRAKERLDAELRDHEPSPPPVDDTGQSRS